MKRKTYKGTHMTKSDFSLLKPRLKTKLIYNKNYEKNLSTCISQYDRSFYAWNQFNLHVE